MWVLNTFVQEGLIRKSFDVNVNSEVYLQFSGGGFLVELQWHVDQNKMAVGFLKTTCYSLGKIQVYRVKKSVFLSLLLNL